MAKKKLIYDRYEPTACGLIYDTKKSRNVKLHKNKSGYLVCNLKKDTKWVQEYVHRLVCFHFKPKNSNLGTVNHRNGIKTDNNIDNLEWVTLSENLTHAWKNGLMSENHTKKSVINISTGERYISVKSASEKTGISKHVLYKSLSGSRLNKTNLRYE